MSWPCCCVAPPAGCGCPDQCGTLGVDFSEGFAAGTIPSGGYLASDPISDCGDVSPASIVTAIDSLSTEAKSCLCNWSVGWCGSPAAPSCTGAPWYYPFADDPRECTNNPCNGCLFICPSCGFTMNLEIIPFGPGDVSLGYPFPYSFATAPFGIQYTVSAGKVSFLAVLQFVWCAYSSFVTYRLDVDGDTDCTAASGSVLPYYTQGGIKSTPTDIIPGVSIPAIIDGSATALTITCEMGGAIGFRPGSWLASFLSRLGFKPCPPCKKRAQALDEWARRILKR